MELVKYSIDEQKGLVHHWNYYYGKGIRTLEDLGNFQQIVENFLDDLLKVMVLDFLTDFKECLAGWPQNYSLCNFIFMTTRSREINPATALSNFFSIVNETFERTYPNPEEKINAINEALDLMCLKIKDADPHPFGNGKIK